MYEINIIKNIIVRNNLFFFYFFLRIFSNCFLLFFFQKKKMPIHLIVGPMFAGKTSLLLKILKKRDMNETVVVKHEKDVRYTVQPRLVSHDGKSIPSLIVKDLSEVVMKTSLSNMKSIVIDEGQFFSNVVEYAQRWAAIGKEVIITALPNGLFMEPITEIANLMAISDKITQLSSQCTSCLSAQAHFTYSTKELPTNADPSDPSCLVGGKDAYTPLCRRCFLKRLQYEHRIKQGVFSGEAIKKYKIPDLVLELHHGLIGKVYV